MGKTGSDNDLTANPTIASSRPAKRGQRTTLRCWIQVPSAPSPPARIPGPRKKSRRRRWWPPPPGGL